MTSLHNYLYYSTLRIPTFQRTARKIPSWKDSDDDNADAGWCASFDASAMSEILEGLYLGGEWSSKRRERLLGAGVTHVLCAAPLPELFPADFRYLRWPIADDGAADLLSALPRLHACIDDALDGGGAVLGALPRGRQPLRVGGDLVRDAGEGARRPCVRRRAAVRRRATARRVSSLWVRSAA